MGIPPHGYLGGIKAHRKFIIKDKAGKFKNLPFAVFTARKQQLY